MSLKKVQQALDLIEANDDADFVGPISEETIIESEERLELVFPPSYKLFLSTLGCGDIDGLEFYGIVSSDLSVVGVPNAIWVTLDERKRGLPHRYVIIGAGGDGTFFAINTATCDENGECPVDVVSPGGDASRCHGTFGEYFYEELENVFE
ncbi:SMI1/KNR4 family protein [Roseibium album]|uniref:SMI1/KNR4 family protein n=1 Tax=Roseibium album TaxID=311410 RepID=UPI00391DD5C3